MYSLDVNFLKDRNLDTGAKVTSTSLAPTRSFSLTEQLPLLIGGAVMVILPAITASSLLVLNQLSSSTQQRIQQLDSQLGQLNAQNKSIEEIEAKVKQNDEEIKSLVTVFNQIRPWSALLREIEGQIPPNVRVNSIIQKENELSIIGLAITYDDLNDFLLTLQSSPLLEAEETVIETASLQDIPVEIEVPDNVEVETPKGVRYTIKTAISDRPSSDLRRIFSDNGAIGLINRIETLERKGVLKR
ncbi:MAG: PilN domain-containing protein [Crocosphaera sp.]|nr:PilN domain-containing protein [Crocosphaera sp.]